MQTYHGACHCKAVTFSFEHEPVSGALRCNCSLCRRKGALMSDFILAPSQLKITGMDALGLYQFGDKIARHYFCQTCGIYPFHETARQPGHFRVNLGCIDEIDADALPVKHFDGKNLL